MNRCSGYSTQKLKNTFTSFILLEKEKVECRFTTEEGLENI
jgi:hypothetical protein